MNIDDDANLALDDVITVAVCAEKDISSLKEFCSKYHCLGVKHIGCIVKGVCGFICDDFLTGFKVTDSDGEVSREVRKYVAASFPFFHTFTSAMIVILFMINWINIMQWYFSYHCQPPLISYST